MSRSFRHIPIMGISGTDCAQKKFKKQEHKRERTAIKQQILKDVLPHSKEYGNEWDSPRDGKTYFGKTKDRWPEEYSKWMRK